MFVNYNDYELLYLINDEGSEQAFQILFEKYSVLIKKIICDFMHETDKREDMYQEGLLILTKCIQNFNDNMNACFYTYLRISLRRRFIVLKRDKYFCRDTTIIKELPVIDRTFFNYSYYEKILRNSSDELGMLYFEDCLCMGNSLSTFARANNLTYYEASKVKDKVINELKKNIE